MRISSPVFVQNGHIPSKYTCDGENVNPPLKIDFVPTLAKSLALIVDDPDIPDFVKEKFHIQVFDHWTAFNISPDVREISEGEEPGTMGKNGRHLTGYTGPCPPDREHRYFFKLYALDKKLELKEGATKAQVEEAMKGHILEKAELIGLYEKRDNS